MSLGTGTSGLSDAQFILRAAEAPDVVLGKPGRLGWTTWLKTKPLPRDADDLILNPPASSNVENSFLGRASSVGAESL